MVSNYSRRYDRPILPEEQKLYDHLLYWIERELPQQMIARFQRLFIQGTGYPDPEVAEALKLVVSSRLASEDFRFVLNRCCHILINRWQARCQTQPMIPELIQLFESSPRSVALGAGLPPTVRRLHQLVQQFTQTEQYQTLHRLAQVLGDADVSHSESRPLGTLIRRYPYLYEHCLLSEDSMQEQQRTVREIQSTMQRQFEIQLAQYVTYQVRQSQELPQAARLIQPVNNPTLLNEQELTQALHYYTGKVDGIHTHRDQALSLLKQSQFGPSRQSQSFGCFKDALYEYITATIEPGYGNRQFNNQLHQQLSLILPESHTQPLNDFLLVRTCHRLLSFLVVDSPQQPHHYLFVDLVTNLGAIVTTGLLLRIALLCRKVIPSLKKRLAILFSHYEKHQRQEVQWLIQALENIHLALTTNFGTVHLLLPGSMTSSW